VRRRTTVAAASVLVENYPVAGGPGIAEAHGTGAEVFLGPRRPVRDCGRTRGQPSLLRCEARGSFLCSSSAYPPPVPTMMAATATPAVAVATVPVVAATVPVGRRAVVRQEQAVVVQQAAGWLGAVARGARRAPVARQVPVARGVPVEAVQAEPPVAKACVHARSFAPAVPAQNASANAKTVPSFALRSQQRCSGVVRLCPIVISSA
jgi:hypothetical protein